MTGVAAYTTDDIGSVVALLWTVVFSVTNLSTILASLVLVVAERTVEGGELTELVSLELILAFGNRGSLETVNTVLL